MTYRNSDMPRTASGLVPDIILNPHAMPSRMTIATLIEGLMAKLAAVKGASADGTTFLEVDVKKIADELAKYGFNRYGKERLLNGMTGEFLDTEIFIVPMYYQRLQKFVKDSVYSVANGPSCPLTRQPLNGMQVKGGLRLGEMERDTLVSGGAVNMLMDKFFQSSDGFDIYVCRTCGQQAIVNIEKNIYKCKTCGDKSDIARVPSSYSSKLFLEELNAMNVGTRRILKPYRIEGFE